MRKVRSLNIPRKQVKTLQIIAIFIVIAFLLRFPAIARFVAGIIAPNDPTMPDKLMNIGQYAFLIGMGLMFISLGINALAIPYFGVILVALGIAIIGVTFYKIYGKQTTTAPEA